MEQRLKEKTSAVVQELYGLNLAPEDVTVNIPPREFRCDYSIVVFSLAKKAGRHPDAMAREIGTRLREELPAISRLESVKGFLNVTLSDATWLEFLYERASRPAFLQHPPSGRKVMIEYCGPNTNKPLHLGHLRNIFVGYAMANILKAAGFEVVKVNIYNDRGIHICKSMLAYQLFGNHETPESSGEKGDHLVGEYYVRYEQELKKQISGLVAEGLTEELAKKQAPLTLSIQEMLRKWEEGDPEVRNLWALLNGWVYQGFEETYQRLGVDFDKAYYESETYQLGKKLVEEGVQKGVFYKNEDGSVWVDLTADGLDQKLLQRADGTSVYITQDIGTADLRWKDFGCPTMIYTVGNEQDYHFRVLKLICTKLEKPYAAGIFHLSYGMVDLPSGRMKSREGTVVDADDLIDEMIRTAEKHTKELGKVEGFNVSEIKKLYTVLGLGALKFFILKVDPKKRMVFNPEESIDFQGFTGPFIQYTYARIQSVFRKSENHSAGTVPPTGYTLQEEERDLIRHVSRYPFVIRESAQMYDPSLVANYLYHLARLYNHFYQNHSILSAGTGGVKSFRLSLSGAVSGVVRHGMNLLGIEVPDRM